MRVLRLNYKIKKKKNPKHKNLQQQTNHRRKRFLYEDSLCKNNGAYDKIIRKHKLSDSYLFT